MDWRQQYGWTIYYEQLNLCRWSEQLISLGIIYLIAWPRQEKPAGRKTLFLQIVLMNLISLNKLYV
jgi:hypothetical protein